MIYFGLKLWSINENYIKEAISLYKQGIYNYIELYTVPDSYNNFIDLWKTLDIPYIIHAPHYYGGLNLARKENKDKNIRLIGEVIKFADSLKARYIIFHPGVAGDINETVLQLNEIADSRILIENKPYYALKDGLVCNGSSPEEIKFIMEMANVGLCLDMGHAICSANVYKIDPLDYIKGFINLKPMMYHLTDGDYTGLYDSHKHFGIGNLPVKAILDILPLNCYITIETEKNSQDSLSDFVEDIEYLRRVNCDRFKTEF